MHAQKQNAGFTLVELAIVLVIIGLLVGGVLVGQDLIKASEIRATVKQMEDVNAAVNTFRTKFGGYPGDLVANKAAAFGLTTRAGTAGQGNGNGLIEGSDGADAVVNTALGYENALFWVDLSSADMIADAFSTATDGPAVSLATNAAFANYLPQTKLRESTYIHVTVSKGKNYYYIANMTETDADGIITSTAGLNQLESKSIDEKMDDGYPTSGTAIAVTALASDGFTEDAGAAAATGECVNTTTTPDDYNVSEDYAAEVNCQLVARASF